jgi:hypothetical protein
MKVSSGRSLTMPEGMPWPMLRSLVVLAGAGVVARFGLDEAGGVVVRVDAAAELGMTGESKGSERTLVRELGVVA